MPGKKAGEFVATAIHDFEGHQTYSEKPGHRFRLNQSLRRRESGDYDALVIPGGRAPEYLRLDERVLDIVRSLRRRRETDRRDLSCGRRFSTAAGVVEGRRCQAYPAVKPELVQAGAHLGRALARPGQRLRRRQSRHRPGLARPSGLDAGLPDSPRHASQ